MPASPSIRVMTFNLRYASAPDGVFSWANPGLDPDRRAVAAEVFLRYRPQLAGLQEGEAGQLDDLMSRLPPRYRLLKQGPCGGGGREHAAIVYDADRFALLEHGVFALGLQPGPGHSDQPPGAPFDPWALFPESRYPFPRLVLRGLFASKPDGARLWFYSTHFDVYNPAHQGLSQINSATLIAADVQARTKGPGALTPRAILVADFNSHRGNRPWRILTGAEAVDGIAGDFTDAWLEVHGHERDAGTMHDFAGGLQPSEQRIDWILHRGGFTTLRAELANRPTDAIDLATGATRPIHASDHYPVIAELAWSPAARSSRPGGNG